MAHELDMSNGRANMMYAGDRPWHGLGKYVGDQPVTAEEAIVAAGMDWDVNLREMYTYPTDTSLAVQVPDRFAVTRSDTHDVLGTVGKVFTPLQNREAFKFMDAVAGPERLVRYHTAGSLFGGEQVWLLAELTNLVADIVPNDPLRPYMCLINGHTGKMNLQVFPTAVRVVCNNTKTMAIGAAKEDKDTSPYVKIRHSRKIHDKVEEARRALGFAVERVEAFTGCMRHLARKPITSAQWNDMLDQLVPVPELPEGKDSSRGRTMAMNKHARLTELFEAGVGADIPGVRGTGWGAYNAITQYTTHDFAVRAGNKDASDYQQRKSERLLDSSWFGAGADMNKRGLKLLLEA
jgi:phage/plasmid-like protein (TIGR03299 family)